MSATLLRDVALRALRLKNLRACARESRRPIERAFVSLSRSRSRALASIHASRHPRARFSSFILRHRATSRLSRVRRVETRSRFAHERGKKTRARAQTFLSLFSHFFSRLIKYCNADFYSNFKPVTVVPSSLSSLRTDSARETVTSSPTPARVAGTKGRLEKIRQITRKTRNTL